MAHDLCPWLWLPGHDLPHPVAHAHRLRDPWPLPNMRAPRWAFPNLANPPCCDFCRAPGRIVSFMSNDGTFASPDYHQPGLGEGLADLGHLLPPIVHSIFEAFHNIHYHYQLGLDTESEDLYFLAQEIEGLSRHVRKLYRAFPDMIELALWADQLKCLGRDIQIGPRRIRHSPMSRNRYNRGYPMPQIAC
ncbi:hypothetical protein BM1_03894 [Bipolaris maydis]|nr:hypothetical protein BM1_03894 [Bipolaris maydis]